LEGGVPIEYVEREQVVVGTRLPEPDISQALAAGAARAPNDVGTLGTTSGGVQQTAALSQTATPDQNGGAGERIGLAEAGFIFGFGCGFTPGCGAAHQIGVETRALNRPNPNVGLGWSIGVGVGGVVATAVGLLGDGFGGAVSFTGVGAVVGVPAMALSTTLAAGGIANAVAGARGISQALMSKGSGATGDGARRPWQPTQAGTARVVGSTSYGRYYQSKSDGLWWSRDMSEHGGSAWKVFRETSKGLEWVSDADEFGTFIVNKHKGDVGMLVPWNQLSATGF
jgi:hypothetical protein